MSFDDPERKTKLLEKLRKTEQEIFDMNNAHAFEVSDLVTKLKNSQKRVDQLVDQVQCLLEQIEKLEKENALLNIAKKQISDQFMQLKKQMGGDKLSKLEMTLKSEYHGTAECLEDAVRQLDIL